MAERKQDARVERANEMDNAVHEAEHATNLAVEHSGTATQMQDQGKQAEYDRAMAQRSDANRRALQAELRRIKAVTGNDPDVTWVVSNRVDDRPALYEVDDRHPSGNAYVAGSTPDFVFRTPAVLRLLNEGVLVEVPEPKDGPKKPLVVAAPTVGMTAAAQPGQPIRLGRALDPDLFDPGAREQVKAQQEGKPQEVAVPYGVVVPPAVAPERDTVRR